MPYYSNASDIKSIWKQAKDADAGLIVKAIKRAYNLINAAIVCRYALPFSITPPLIESISDDLSVYFLKRLLNPGAGDLTDESRNMYKAAIDELKDLQSGKASLVDSNGTLIAVKPTISSTTEDYQPIFNLDDWESQNIDEDRLEAIEDAR